MVGLGVALALANGRRRITLLERDLAPPAAPPKEMFQIWQRRGVTQLRHSHIFLGRLTALFKERHPLLLKELLDAGARLGSFEEYLPPALRRHYVPSPGDEYIAPLFCRRATLEYVVRRHVERLEGVTILPDVTVRGVIARRKDDVVVVEGLQYEMAKTSEVLHADVIVDATGRNSLFPNWLRAQGIEIAEERNPAGILYFTRHYRSRRDEEPAQNNEPTGGDLGYIKFGICPADNRYFSITFAIPETEKDLRHAIMEPAVFDAVCAQIPGCSRWTDTTRAVPTSPIYAMGNLVSIWRRFLKDGKPQLLNFFALGDAAMRTNPLYGRGCSTGILHAHLLREVMEATADARARAIMLEERMHAAFRPYFESMVRQDVQSVHRAERENGSEQAQSFKAILKKTLIEDGLVPAMQGDLEVVRASARAYHMIEPPIRWLRRPALLARILAMWARSRSYKQAHHLYPPSLGPSRQELLLRIGLTS